jgi:hypothetical protein
MDTFDMLDVLRRERHLIPTMLIAISNIIDEEANPSSLGVSSRLRLVDRESPLPVQSSEESLSKEHPLFRAE